MSINTPPSLDELAAQIAALQAQVAALGASADNLAPNYITITPDGQVSADFTGTITAEGLTIPVPPDLQAGAPPYSIQWETQPGGSLLAWIGYNDDNDPDFAAAVEGLYGPFGLNYIVGEDDLPPYQPDTLKAIAGAQTINLITSNGPGVIPLPCTQPVWASGVLTVTWNGESQTAAGTIYHELGYIPELVLLAAWCNDHGDPVAASQNGAGDNYSLNIKALDLIEAPPNGTTAAIPWIAGS